MGVNCNRNLTSLRLGKSEIVLLPRGVQHTEGEEFIPFDHSLVRKRHFYLKNNYSQFSIPPLPLRNYFSAGQ